jgi:hypothetical protein
MDREVNEWRDRHIVLSQASRGGVEVEWSDACPCSFTLWRLWRRENLLPLPEIKQRTPAAQRVLIILPMDQQRGSSAYLIFIPMDQQRGSSPYLIIIPMNQQRGFSAYLIIIPVN